jgi:hypothetical protein
MKKETRNIYNEIKLLAEIKDIQDELNIIIIVLEEQKKIFDQPATCYRALENGVGHRLVFN